LQEAPRVAVGGDRKDCHRQAAGINFFREVTSFSVPAEEISGEQYPESKRWERVNVFTPQPEVFLFSVSSSYAFWLIKQRMVRVMRSSKRFRGVSIIPEQHIAAMATAVKEIHKPSGGRRVLGYAHKEYSEFVPAGVWTLDRLPDWAQAVFLKVAFDRGAWPGSAQPRPRRRAKVIEMPKPANWREKMVKRIAA